MATPDEIVAHPNSVAEFNKVINATKFVVVDFWADWCPPCKAISPLFTKLAKATALPGYLSYASINVDDVPEVAQEYGVTTMPSFLFFASGELGSVDTNGTVKGGGAVLESDRRVRMIRGADPRALVACAEALGRTAKAAKAAAEAPKPAAAEPAPSGDDGKTVSGSYSLDPAKADAADVKA